MKEEMKLLVLGLEINNIEYTNCQNLKLSYVLAARKEYLDAFSRWSPCLKKGPIIGCIAEIAHEMSRFRRCNSTT
jgi:hypothetical protein